MTHNQQQPKGFRLDGKVAIVTGAASGIGRAIAQRFAQEGAVVRVVDLNERDANTAAQEITATGGCATAYVCDVSNQRTVTEVFHTLAAQKPINILVNCAGISHIGKLESTTEADFDRVFTVNVKGTYNCMYAAIESMKASGGGAIVNMASIAATAGLADRFAYSMSKGAALSMTLSVARDYLPHKIRCNCISPARVHTAFVDGYLKKNYPGREKEMFQKLSETQPIGRMADPKEVAALALFLCSDEAAFITGTDYPIDGGFFNLHG
ncbi:MAG TPA: glucose 1-dehydrogenase [Candidatus Acidoferrum sp.]|nr:glucose 1-dehydrogenase [Candidatus Acidoferrum sp.]